MFALKPCLLAGFTWLFAASATLACADRQAAIDAVDTLDFATATALQERITLDPDCDDALRIWLDEALARDVFRQARTATDPAQARALYEASLDLSPHWRTLDALGRLASSEGDHEGEARYLQTALNQIKDGPEHHSITEQEIRDLYSRASTAMLLAKTAVKLPRTRSGETGGIFITSLRGYDVDTVPYAIEFEFDSVELTQKGRDYAMQLVEHLTFSDIAAIGLEGHTDPVGPDAYNMALSERRAKALGKYLEENGYTGEVSIFAKGETEQPNAVDKNVEPGSPEHHQIARRVQLIWS